MTIQALEPQASMPMEEAICVASPQAKIKAYLMKGGRLTVLRALRIFGTTELRRIVSRLRKEGITIAADRLEVETSNGRKQMVCEYYCPIDRV